MTLTCTFTTTKRMINRVHSHTTNSRANSAPSVAASLSKLCIHAVFITDDTNSCIALGVHTAKLTRRKADCYILTLFSSNKSTGTGRANQLSATSQCQLNVMNSKTDRNS